jgi:hypothetical protein
MSAQSPARRTGCSAGVLLRLAARLAENIRLDQTLGVQRLGIGG